MTSRTSFGFSTLSNWRREGGNGSQTRLTVSKISRRHNGGGGEQRVT